MTDGGHGAGDGKSDGGGGGGGAGHGSYGGDVGCDAMGDMRMLEVTLTMVVAERMVTRRGD